MDSNAFLEQVKGYRDNRWRLMLINATTVLPRPDAEAGAFDISWSFEREGQVEHVRHHVAPEEDVPSICTLYGCAFLYENEMHELFGVKVSGMQVDFKGELYRAREKVPFSPRAIQARLAARGGKQK